MMTLRKPLWALAAVLLVLCLRVNAERDVDGTIECLDPKFREAVNQSGCETHYVWSVSLKLPWRQW
jgi:hypothetical protein